MVWYSHLFQNFPQFIVIHTVQGFGIVNKAELDVFFLEFSWFFNDPMDILNLISGSSAFLKSSLNIWKFLAHVLLKPGLENFEHYFTTCEMSASVCTSSITFQCNVQSILISLFFELFSGVHALIHSLQGHHLRPLTFPHQECY